MRKNSLKFLVLVLGMVFLFGGKSYAEEIEMRGVIVGFDITITENASNLLSTEKDNDGNTPLHSACKNNYIEIVKLLLNSGVQVNEQNNDGFTALHYACENGNVEIVKSLLQAGANVKIRNNNGDDALNYVCAMWKRDIIDLFEQRGCNQQRNITYKHNEKEIMNLLLDNGANIDSKNKDNNTVLDDFSRILYEKSYEFNYNKEKSSLLSSLVNEIEWLLKCGATVNDVRDLNGNNLLNFACKNGYENVVKLLLNK